MKTFKNIIQIGAMLLFVGLFSACERDVANSLDLHAEVNVLAFEVGNVNGEINNETGTITVMVPEGTDLSQIAPVIDLPVNATVKPASGTPHNFMFSATTPLVYRVYNGNLYNTYHVTVKEIKGEITAFRIGDKAGIIDQTDKTVMIFLPEGTGVGQLSPAIEYTEGAEISPVQGSYVDFSSPVTYKVTYMGQTFTYTVTVILGDEPKLPLIISNNENIAPLWGDLGTAVTNQTANPRTDGINSSPMCVSMVRNASTGEGWHGGALWNEHKVNIDPAEYNRFSIMVLKEVAGDVQLEIQSDGEANKDWLRAWYSEDNLGEWQELIFEIPEGRTAIINNILVMPNEHANGQPVAFETQRMYWDELKALPKE